MATVEQVRGARGLLGWSQTELGMASGLSLPTVKRYETGNGARVSAEAVSKMRRALEAAGIIFVEENGEGPGVRLRKEHKKPADVTRAMAERTEQFLNREEVVARANMREIQDQAEKHAGEKNAAGAERRKAARGLAEEMLDERLDDVDASPDEKERRKAALTKPPRRGPK